MDRRYAFSMLVLGVWVATLAGCVGENQTDSSSGTGTVGGDDRNGEYMPAVDWWKPAPNHDATWHWGQVSGVSAIDPDRVFAVHWGDMNDQGELREPRSNAIAVANRNGEITEVWTQWDSILNWPHQVYVDPYDPAMPVWVVERGGGGPHMQVLKFSNDGKELLLRIGYTPIPESLEEARSRTPGPYEYGQPAVLAFFPNGDFLLGDGYWNCRVVRYNGQGEYLSEFGTCGDGPGEFDTVHGLAIDRDHRIYVVDRSNDRIQVFEEDGTFVAEWPDIASPTGIWVDESNSVWVIGRTTNRMLKYDTDGHLLYHWGTYGGTSSGFDGGSGGFQRPHQVSVDREGNLYVANFDGESVGKFTPRPDADPARLIGKRAVR
jgi:DNA-binding beta-propeller fold protein YncE